MAKERQDPQRLPEELRHELSDLLQRGIAAARAQLAQTLPDTLADLDTLEERLRQVLRAAHQENVRRRLAREISNVRGTVSREAFTGAVNTAFAPLLDRASQISGGQEDSGEVAEEGEMQVHHLGPEWFNVREMADRAELVLAGVAREPFRAIGHVVQVFPEEKAALDRFFREHDETIKKTSVAIAAIPVVANPHEILAQIHRALLVHAGHMRSEAHGLSLQSPEARVLIEAVVTALARAAETFSPQSFDEDAVLAHIPEAGARPLQEYFEAVEEPVPQADERRLTDRTGDERGADTIAVTSVPAETPAPSVPDVASDPALNTRLAAHLQWKPFPAKDLQRSLTGACKKLETVIMQGAVAVLQKVAQTQNGKPDLPKFRREMQPHLQELYGRLGTHVLRFMPASGICESRVDLVNMKHALMGGIQSEVLNIPVLKECLSVHDLVKQSALIGEEFLASSLGRSKNLPSDRLALQPGEAATIYAFLLINEGGLDLFERNTALYFRDDRPHLLAELRSAGVHRPENELDDLLQNSARTPWSMLRDILMRYMEEQNSIIPMRHFDDLMNVPNLVRARMDLVLERSREGVARFPLQEQIHARNLRGFQQALIDLYLRLVTSRVPPRDALGSR